jgi:hypothetical protein
MHNPPVALKEVRRILNKDAVVFLSVDIGGEPTPDEPTVFCPQSLETLLLEKQFEIVSCVRDAQPNSASRPSSARITARKESPTAVNLDKDEILRRYTSRLGDHG